MRAAAPAPSPLREVRLYGVLGRKFGRVHRLAVGSPREAMHALTIVLPGFGQHMIEHSEPGYHVFLGKRGQNNLGPEQLDRPVSAREPICVVPVVAGAKQQGTFQTVVGIVLIALSYWNPFGWALGAQLATAQLGGTLAFSGTVQMIAAQGMGGPEPKAAGVPSYRFDGPVNSTQEGLPVPLRYGRTIFGPHIISGGIVTERIFPAAAPSPMPPATLPAEEPLDPIGGSTNYEGSP